MNFLFVEIRIPFSFRVRSRGMSLEAPHQLRIYVRFPPSSPGCRLCATKSDLTVPVYAGILQTLAYDFRVFFFPFFFFSLIGLVSFLGPTFPRATAGV